MNMKWIPFSITTNTAGAGVATGNTDSSRPIRGLVHAVYVDYHASAPATTDVTVRTKGAAGGPPTQTILSLANLNTDGVFYPAAIPVSTANAAITNANRPVPVCDVLNVLVAQANDSQLFTVWVLVEE